jgi:hypothetical protein
MQHSEKNPIIPDRRRSFRNRIQHKLDEAQYNWPGYLEKLSLKQMKATIACIIMIDDAFNLDELVHELDKMQDFLILSLMVQTFSDDRKSGILRQIQMLTTLRMELGWIRDYGCRRWM